MFFRVNRPFIDHFILNNKLFLWLVRSGACSFSCSKIKKNFHRCVRFSFIPLFIHAVCPILRAFVRLFICSFMASIYRSFVCSFMRANVRMFVYAFLLSLLLRLWILFVRSSVLSFVFPYICSICPCLPPCIGSLVRPFVRRFMLSCVLFLLLYIIMLYL